MVLAVLAACASEPKVVTEYKTIEKKVPVPVVCPVPNIEPTPGPDLAPQDANVFEAARYVREKLVWLRGEVDALREALRACGEIE